MKTKTANEIIQKHYCVNRPVTDMEVIDELVSLRRKLKKGNLDDCQERLVAELQTNGNVSLTIESELPECPNCKERSTVCACLRNTCLQCGSPVGNITFTVCDACFPKQVNT